MSDNECLGRKEEVLVLLPYCVKNLGELERLARDGKFNMETVRHDEDVPGILQKHNPSFILGVACEQKVKSVGAYLDSIGMPYRAISFGSRGCLKVGGEGAVVDIDKYSEALRDLA